MCEIAGFPHKTFTFVQKYTGLPGFDDPSVLTVNYKTSSGAAETFALYIGNQNMDGTGRYVRIGEESAVYLMELSLLDPMMRLAYQGLEGSAD